MNDIPQRHVLRLLRKALECFELFKKTYPEDRRSKPSRTEGGTFVPARVDSRMEVLYAAVGRLSR